MANDCVRPIVRGFFLVGSVDWLVEVALTTAIYQRTGSTSWVAAAVALRFVPAIAVGPLAGVLADRLDRRVVVVGSCMARAVALSLLAAVSFDAPATVHVVEAGSLQVIVEADGDTRLVNELGPGDWFGEIGVVGERPRTATVLAETDARVWNIPASAFLDAVASSAPVSDPLTRGMHVRLARTTPNPVLP
jgi:MFS family permease